MFGSLGMPELILIFIVALLVFGPKKLPDIGKSLGKGLAEFKRASDELKKTIETEIEQGKAEVAAVKDHVSSVSSSLRSAVSLSTPDSPTVPREAAAAAPGDAAPVTVAAASVAPAEPASAPVPEDPAARPEPPAIPPA
jgi:TatA/E family protein of Tat protein translocase